nr:hypothetical protein Iba_chr11eCG2900 [Ipomoea batatas]
MNLCPISHKSEGMHIQGHKLDTNSKIMRCLPHLAPGKVNGKNM